MISQILSIFSLGVKPMIEYNNIVTEFRNKLPREQNEARTLKDTELNKNGFFHESKKLFSVIDLSSNKISLTEADIDLFYNKLDNFDYRFIPFKKYYKSYTKNLKRFKPKAESGNFDLVMVQKVLKFDRNLYPVEPIDVFTNYLKFRNPITTKIYQLFLRNE